MLFRMSDDKSAITEPTVVISTSQDGSAPKKGRLTKKHLLIAAISLIVTGLVVTAVLVGIKIYTDSNLEVLKYQMQAQGGFSQNVSTDSGSNVVTYHVAKPGVEAWIVMDFDKDIQVSKVLIDGKTNCYVTPLNRSIATDASSIPETAPEVAANAPTNQILYQVSSQAISDISYLGKKVSTMCQNIPTYHAVPDCGAMADNSGVQVTNSTAVDHRAKRTPRFCATCNRPNCLCACGCCSIVCAWFASSSCVLSYYSGAWHCTYYYYTGYLYAVYSLAPSCYYSPYYYNP